jgi:hypothetical protein
MTTILPIIFQNQAKLRPEIINEIRKDKYLKSFLLLHFDISASTLQNWLDKSSPNLTQYSFLEILRQHFHAESIDSLLYVYKKL